MKNILYTLTILFIGLNVSAQDVTYINSKPTDLPTVYMIGGIASVITKEDIAFAKKYNIQFHDFGCLAPSNMEKYEKLNTQVFDQLNKEFGSNWQKEIRKGILGYERWKKS
jgi:hypothetical protein